MIFKNSQKLILKIDQFLTNGFSAKVIDHDIVDQRCPIYSAFTQSLSVLSYDLHYLEEISKTKRTLIGIIGLNNRKKNPQPNYLTTLQSSGFQNFCKLTVQQKIYQTYDQEFSKTRKLEYKSQMAFSDSQSCDDSDNSQQNWQSYGPGEENDDRNSDETVMKSPQSSTSHNICCTLEKIIEFQKQTDEMMEQILSLPHQEYLLFMKSKSHIDQGIRHFIDEENTSEILNLKDQIEEMILVSEEFYNSMIAQDQQYQINIGKQLNFSKGSSDCQKYSLLSQLLKENILPIDCGSTKVPCQTSTSKTTAKNRRPLPKQMKLNEHRTHNPKQIKAKKLDNYGSCSQRCTIY